MGHFMKRRMLFGLLVGICLIAFDRVGAMAQNTKAAPVFQSDVGNHWVDSVFRKMTPEERIGQLIFVAAYSDRGLKHEVQITDLIRKYKIGGLIFFKGTPDKQAALTNYYQSQSKVPLFIAMDAEWGLRMRLEHTIHFPYQMALGAIKNDSLIYEMGLEIGRELRLIGVQMNLAPVVDINNNPNNPVIGFRSFGMNKRNVAEKGIAYMKGLQDAGVIATAKHFPGHGDTGKDSHKTLPVVPFTWQRLDTLELYPFKKMIDAGVGAVMTAHLYVPALDPTPHLASSLSKPIVSGLLKGKLGFQGLVITDALNMKGVTKYFPPGVVEVKALQAGNDILEFTENVSLTISSIKKSLAKGTLSWDQINMSCKKILAAKYWAGLNHYQPVDTTHLVKDLNTPKAQVLDRKLIKALLTVLRNKDSVIPVNLSKYKKIATIIIGDSTEIPFQKMLNNYTDIDNYYWVKRDVSKDSMLIARLRNYDLVIVGLDEHSPFPTRNFGLSPAMIQFFRNLMVNQNNLVAVLGNPLSINKLMGIENAKGVVLSYRNGKLAQQLTAQLIFGAIGSKGKLPVELNQFALGTGINTPAIGRLAYTIPEEEGVNSADLNHEIDSIVDYGLQHKAYPGCEVLVARNGAVIFHKVYGYHTYYKRVKVDDSDLYDLASITKVVAALPAIMKLYDEKKIRLDVPFYKYWPAFKHSNKRNITLREILAHQAGLESWIPFWRRTLKGDGKLERRVFRSDSSSKFDLPVDGYLFMNRKYVKKIYKEIKKSPVMSHPKYLYSGLAFYLFPQIVKNLTGETFQAYLKTQFYQPLGANSLTYNPYKYDAMPYIVPTEVDTFFRKKPIHGYVHDEGAAMMGGISGNAGLFGTANDLAKLTQMYLNMGYYGGVQYIADTTMKEFTSIQYPENGNRRGLGFDKPLIGNDTLPELKSYPTLGCSPASFGHSGFTGTFFWADPRDQVLYIFLSNRVYPTRANDRIVQYNIRTNILQAVYDAIDRYKTDNQ
jgi:beta-glucosidase-like glycosyl hydrolase/CubicO group peptidase (beta-lactamase class C family)